ncbi:MAG: septum formation initiator family protein [Candidatus Acidiferrum sp.]
MATAYQWSGPGSAELLAAGQSRYSKPARPRLVAQAPRQTVAKANRWKKPAVVEFYTVKKIDNSRLVRRVEPVKLRNLYKTVALGGIIAAFCMLYAYQHFRCIDLSFQLEDLKGKQELAQAANGKLKLEIATLRDPHRIDVIARHQLGLTQPTASQVREYAAVDGAEVAAVQYTRPNRAP